MESPPDPASDPGNSASEPATPVRETLVNLETLRKAEHPAPVRRQTCSSTNRGKSGTPFTSSYFLFFLLCEKNKKRPIADFFLNIKLPNELNRLHLNNCTLFIITQPRGRFLKLYLLPPRLLPVRLLLMPRSVCV